MEGSNSTLISKLDQLMENNDSISLEDFYFNTIRPDESRETVFENRGDDSLFAVLCTDELREYCVVTKKSYARAKKVFKFDAKHPGLTDKLIHDIFDSEAYTSIDKCFYGFASEDLVKKILLPGQWLTRCDDDGFILITTARPDPAAQNPSLLYKNHRVEYDVATSEYVLTENGEVIRFTTWNSIVERFGDASAAEKGPLMAASEGSVVYNWREGEYDIIGFWIKLLNGNYWLALPCFFWYCSAITIKNPKDFYNKTLAEMFTVLRGSDQTIRIIDHCLAHGADLNNELCPLYDFARNSGWPNSGAVAAHIWKLGADPNAVHQGIPAFFMAARAQRTAHTFLRHPKLDVNMVIAADHQHAGKNVAWYHLNKTDYAVLEDKRFNLNVIRQGKSLMDVAIELLDIPFILKLISCGIDMTRSSATKLGTYLHAFLDNSKNLKDEDILTVVAAMIDAGIDVQSLNALYQTPLHVATAKSTPDVVRALIETYNANPSGHQESDSTPLHVAAERGDVNMVKTLIELGADQQRKNARGQIPRDAGLYAVKTLFSNDNKLQDLKFTAVKVAITNPAHPQAQTNLAVINGHLYTHGGHFHYVNWWDEYGHLTLHLFPESINKIERLPLDDILDKSKKRTWEEIPSSPLRYVNLHIQGEVETFIQVKDKLWFHGETNWVVLDPVTKTWTEGVPRDRYLPHKPNLRPHFDYYNNQILVPMQKELRIIKKTNGATTTVPIDQGDHNVEDYILNGVMQDTTCWFVAKSEPKILFAMNTELRKIFKVFQFDFALTSSLVCFGNRFLISHVVVEFQANQKLFVLDLQTMSYALHDLDFDVDPEKDFNSLEDTTISAEPDSEEARDMVHCCREKLHFLLLAKKLPFSKVALAIHQSTLLLYGGIYDNMISQSYLFAVDLSRLVPLLSLEYQAALAVLNNKNKLGPGQVLKISEDLRSKLGLY